jgi:Fe2+ or Zn2+ uptake regulation protein
MSKPHHEPSMQDFRRRLHREGRRMTVQRAAVLQALRGTRSHPTAEQVLELALRKIPDMSLGTVYRNLTVLVEEGLALKLPNSHGSQRFDGDVSRHHHVICDSCGAVADAVLPRAPDVIHRVAEATGWEVFPTEIIFHGRCPHCASAEDAKGN